MLNFTSYEVKIVFTEQLLGTVPGDEKIYRSYISQVAAAEGKYVADELDTVTRLERGVTGFHRLRDGTPILYDYVVRGFFKESCGALWRVPGSLSGKMKAYKKIIDSLVFVEPRQIPLRLAGPSVNLERPLRVSTAQGERVALASSYALAVGASCTFRVRVLGDTVTQPLLEEWLEYGQLKGLGQWRSGGYGRFRYELSAG